MGFFGFSHIYAKGEKRCLVDPETSQSTFEYSVTTSDTGQSTINIKGLYQRGQEKRTDAPSIASGASG